MKPSKTSPSKSKKQNLMCSFAKVPPHLFTIPALSFQKEIENRTINESWFKLGEWTHGYDTDKNGLQLTVMRQCLLIPLGKFETVFDSLESVGNVLHGMGSAGGSLFSNGSSRSYKYQPFHSFDLGLMGMQCEPIVFVLESNSPKCLSLNPDPLIHLGLVEKVAGSGIWWDPTTSAEVLKHVKAEDGLETLSMRSDFLRRYLQARQMSLLVGHYAHRHLYNPSAGEIEAFSEGDAILGSPKENAKALLQNWGLRKDVGKPFLQRRLHLWIEIPPASIDLEDPWSEEPPFDPYAFTFPTREGKVAPARWKNFRRSGGRERFAGKTCDFMNTIYFRQEALIKYETSADYTVADNGGVHCSHYWALNRSTCRLGNDFVCTSIGDFAEGVPFSEWQHWQMHAVEPPSYETIEGIRSEKTIPQLVNELVGELQNLNSAFMSFAGAINIAPVLPLWGGDLNSLAGRQLKWVYPASANEDEFIKRATLASTLVIDGLSSECLRELLCAIDPSLHLKDGKPLGSRNLLQRLALVAALVVKVRPPRSELLALVEGAENGKKKGGGDSDLRIELVAAFNEIRADLSALAFLYDLRVHGGLAHPPNQKEAAAAASKLGLPEGHWNRGDFIHLIGHVTNSVGKVSSRLFNASRVLWISPLSEFDGSQAESH